MRAGGSPGASCLSCANGASVTPELIHEPRGRHAPARVSGGSRVGRAHPEPGSVPVPSDGGVTDAEVPRRTAGSAGRGGAAGARTALRFPARSAPPCHAGFQNDVCRRENRETCHEPVSGSLICVLSLHLPQKLIYRGDFTRMLIAFLQCV